jgi:hypothetical protein
VTFHQVSWLVAFKLIDCLDAVLDQLELEIVRYRQANYMPIHFLNVYMRSSILHIWITKVKASGG